MLKLSAGSHLANLVTADGVDADVPNRQRVGHLAQQHQLGVAVVELSPREG